MPDASVRRNVPSSLSRHPVIVADGTPSGSDADSGCGSGSIVRAVDAAGGSEMTVIDGFDVTVFVASSLDGVSLSTAVAAGGNCSRPASTRGASSRAVNNAAATTTKTIADTIARELVNHE